MIKTTILCTHCYAPIRETYRAVDTGTAAFCSDVCEGLDAARRVPLAPVRVLVALIHNGPVVDRKVTQSLIAMGWGNRVDTAKAEHGIASIDLAWFSDSPRVDDLRNKALAQGLRDGFTHVLFLDTDMIHPDDLFHRILKYCAREIVVSGFYTQRHPPFAPIAMRNGQLHESGRFVVYHHDDDFADVDADGLRDEELVGMGCCLIPLSIVRAIGPMPWFEYKTDLEGWHLVSEDVPFCEKVRAAGFAIFLDPAIECGHLFSDFATAAHWRRYREVIVHTQAQLGQMMAVTATPEAD